MSKYKTSNGINIFVKILTAIIVVLLVLGIIGGVMYLLNRPQGLYIEYDGTTYGNTALGSSTGGITVSYGETATFTIGNSDGWGVYSVQDCTVKIVPNVDDTHDFEYTVKGNAKPSVYSGEADLTAAFCEDYDGSGLPIAADGTFAITADKIDVADILEAVYGQTITLDGEYLTSVYPYVALSVTSPDGGQTLTVPLLFAVGVEGIELDKDGIIV